MRFANHTIDFLRYIKMSHSVLQGNNGWLLIVWFKVHDDIIFIKLLGDGTCMNIYDLLKECIEIKKYGLDAGVFKDEDRERLDTEEEKQEVQEMAVDFREAKEVAKEVAKELTEKDSNWKWRVQVLKSEIRVWWGYLQYCDTEDSHFTIKMSDREDERGTDTDFMVARNEHDEYMTGRIIGVDECWQDGDLNTCVAGLLRGIATIAHSRY